jgi:bifunctional non-homologous end joining protein LigD
MGYAKKISHAIKPMLTTAVDTAFNSKEWLFELKLDGYRAIAEVKSKSKLLYSRNGLSLAEKYPVIMEALEKISVEAVLDGEIVALNEKGKPDFQLLQQYEPNSEYLLAYYVFDLLSLMKSDLTKLPLIERKKLLKKLVSKTDTIIYNSHIEERGEQLFKTVKKDNMEGIIAKRIDSFYTPGIRTREWLKIKNKQSQEAIIIGYTQPKGIRLHFGSILLGQYKGQNLEYVGHAGTGFSSATLKELMKKMRPLIVKASPLKKNIKTNGIVTWLRPALVCEVEYSEITRDGLLRHPVYKGLRPEKKSKIIKKETETPVSVKKIIRPLKKAS